jgi:uncharacterized protein YggE
MPHGKRVPSIITACLLIIALGCSNSPSPKPETNDTTNQPTAINQSDSRSYGNAIVATPKVSRKDGEFGIWVVGTGQTIIQPNIGLVELGVESKEATVVAARYKSANAMNSILNVLSDMKVRSEDIQTKYFNISPEYSYPKPTGRRVLDGYRVTNTVNVKVRDLESMGNIIDNVTLAGEDLVRINNIRFTVENTGESAKSAREKAVKDAIAKANQFAKLTGTNLGGLVYISEIGANIPTYNQPIARSIAAPQTFISGGELDITINVQAMFEIN